MSFSGSCGSVRYRLVQTALKESTTKDVAPTVGKEQPAANAGNCTHCRPDQLGACPRRIARRHRRGLVAPAARPRPRSACSCFGSCAASRGHEPRLARTRGTETRWSRRTPATGRKSSPVPLPGDRLRRPGLLQMRRELRSKLSIRSLNCFSRAASAGLPLARRRRSHRSLHPFLLRTDTGHVQPPLDRFQRDSVNDQRELHLDADGGVRSQRSSAQLCWRNAATAAGPGSNSVDARTSTWCATRRDPSM